MASAACLGVANPASSKRDVFFPGRGETSEAAVVKFCLACPVKSDCDDYATRHDITVGIWGGKRRTRDTENGV